MQPITFSLLTLAPCLVEAQKSTTHYSTETVFIPPRKTGDATNIYASVITKDATMTEYLLACQTNFDADTTDYTCDGDFKGVTVTYEGGFRMDAVFGVTSYGCGGLNTNEVICSSQTTVSASDEPQRTTLGSSESSSWMTAITFVDVKKRKPTTTKTSQPEETEAKLCKRRVVHGDSGSDSSSGSSGGSSGDGSSSGTGSGSGSADDADSDTDGADSASPTKKHNNDCSAGSVASWSWGLLVIGLGGYFGLNFV
ncbi:hypothetical protein FHETE_7179 [Fusarium heterosporum]|uniref:Uncharacterized protein n=1 Tax=Fusarium heterosporum TaxID=42747 RepID=A0A8H5T7B2_FUSHE|nr:hypothetical protein FHETE_7179 [Fusarium heterosporum]